MLTAKSFKVLMLNTVFLQQLKIIHLKAVQFSWFVMQLPWIQTSEKKFDADTLYVHSEVYMYIA